MNDMKERIEATLGQFWDERVIPQDAPPVGTVDSLAAALDSLSSCEALIDVDLIVGFKVPVESVIRRGGYADREQFVTELTAAILKQVEKRQS